MLAESPEFVDYAKRGLIVSGGRSARTTYKNFQRHRGPMQLNATALAFPEYVP